MLRRVLEALGHQSRLADEVIVADDGSGLETATMIERFAYDSPYTLYHVWQNDRGFRAAKIRNKAIRKSNGEYIILIDGDCIPGRYFIEDHFSLAERGFFFQGKRVLISRRLSPTFTHEEANSTIKLLKFIFLRDISNAHHLMRFPFFPAFSSTSLSGIRSCNMGFFREDIVAINGFNEDFVSWGREDSELAVRFYRYGLKRKEHLFIAICFHLWHEANDRKYLEINDELLRKAIESNEYFCSNGLV